MVVFTLLLNTIQVFAIFVFNVDRATGNYYSPGEKCQTLFKWLLSNSAFIFELAIKMTHYLLF